MTIIETLKSRLDLKNKKAITVTIDELIEYRQYLKEYNLPIVDKFWNCDLILEITKEQKKNILTEWNQFCYENRSEFLSFDKMLNKYLND